MSDNHFIRIKEQAAPFLFKIPGVRGVGVGPKYVQGRAIGILAIQVFVETKRKISEIKDEDIIPRFIEDIPTDVWEWHKPGNMAAEITVDDCRTGNIASIKQLPSASNFTDLEITSPTHGLFDDARVAITGFGPTPSPAFRVKVIDDDRFSIHIIENGNEISPLTLPYTSNSANWLTISNFDTLCCCPGGPIPTVTTGESVEITSAAHGLIDGDRIKIKRTRPKLDSKIYKIKKVDDNNVKLLNATAADVAGIPSGWEWRKVSIAPSERIHRIEMKNPIVIHSTRHSLADKDKIVISILDLPLRAKLDNLLDRNKPPYEVKVVSDDSFTLAGIDATGFGLPDLQNDFLGSWIKIIEDNKKYDRRWGGIRIEMKDSETETVQRTPTTPGSSPLTPRNQDQTQETVHVQVKLSTGTFGCIATDDLSGKKVLLSNAHVLFSGTDNDEVHHPNYYVSSKTCSKHKIATRVRQVFGIDPAHPDLTVDAAIANFDPDNHKYDPFIADIGLVKGVHNITPQEIAKGDFRVWKRGAQTGITEGIVVSVAFDFPDAKDNVTWKNQIQIRPVSGLFAGFMAVHGDSGSVVVNNENKVVGLLFKAFEGGGATANHIDHVQTALKIKIWKEGDPIAAGDEPIDPQKQKTTVGIPQLFANTIAELSMTESGSSFVGVVRFHYPEVINLMASNKKFAVAWHRNHGPELMRRLRETIEERNIPMPPLINGVPFREFVINIFNALKKFGSARLAEDVDKYERFFLQLLGFTYEGMLQLFQRDVQFARKI